ncbi:EAL domain-containing protein [Vibrio brasiliensis]|uniref:EAL domain-containing protein n=1 Tax=Vibrio brasiliensis TaxID=170652 RepID=UPI001EFD53E0|nr:EAL domain-containing protein [Vibrio brasiliensis]MCG9781542.1 EAL domain-containing protein [Vibrio brasiliensis]
MVINDEKKNLAKVMFLRATRENYEYLSSMGLFTPSPRTLVKSGKKLFELYCQKIIHRKVIYQDNELPSLSIELFFKPQNCENTESYYNNLSSIDCYKISKSQINYTKRNVRKIKLWAVSHGFNVENIFFNIECACLPHIIDDIVMLSHSLKKQGINLVIELTEREYQYNENSMKYCIYCLKDHDISIAIDDFLSIFDHRYGIIPLVDYIKLIFPSDFHDRSWGEFRNLSFYLKEKYEKTLVVEKVETSEHIEFLSTLPFDLVQGYHFDKPSCIDKNVML